MKLVRYNGAQKFRGKKKPPIDPENQRRFRNTQPQKGASLCHPAASLSSSRSDYRSEKISGQPIPHKNKPHHNTSHPITTHHTTTQHSTSIQYNTIHSSPLHSPLTLPTYFLLPTFLLLCLPTTKSLPTTATQLPGSPSQCVRQTATFDAKKRRPRCHWHVEAPETPG